MASNELFPLVFSGRVGTRKAVLRAEDEGLSVEVGDGPQRTVPWAELRGLEVRHELRWVGVTPLDGQGPGPMVVMAHEAVPEVHTLMRHVRGLGCEVRYSSTPMAYLRNELAIARSEDVALRSLGRGARALEPAARAPLIRTARRVAWWACGWGLFGPLALAIPVGGLALGPLGALPALGLALLSVVVLSVLGLHLANLLLPYAGAWLGLAAVPPSSPGEP